MREESRMITKSRYTRKGEPQGLQSQHLDILHTFCVSCKMQRELTFQRAFTIRTDRPASTCVHAHVESKPWASLDKAGTHCSLDVPSYRWHVHSGHSEQSCFRSDEQREKEDNRLSELQGPATSSR